MDESKKDADDPIVLIGLYRLAKMLFEQGETIPESNKAIDRYLTGNIIATHIQKIEPLVVEEIPEDSTDMDNLVDFLCPDESYEAE